MARQKNTVGGGAKTNKNGFAFEELTDLGIRLNGLGFSIEELKEKRTLVQSGWKVMQEGGEEYGLIFKKNGFYRHFLGPNGVNWSERITKKLEPDDCFYSLQNSTFTIIEKKSQSGNGSVDEKLQTADFKLRTYQKLMSGIIINEKPIKVQFCFLLDKYFMKPCYKDVFDYIEAVNCRYFFGEVPLDYLGVEC